MHVLVLFVLCILEKSCQEVVLLTHQTINLFVLTTLHIDFRYGYVRSRRAGPTPSEPRLLCAQDTSDHRGHSTQAGGARQEREGDPSADPAPVHRQPVSVVSRSRLVDKRKSVHG